MKTVFHSNQGISRTRFSYGNTTGRLKKVRSTQNKPVKKIALFGDSTLDNAYWVENGLFQSQKTYCQKTATVTHQAAQSLAEKESDENYDLANFAIDGATTDTVQKNCPLNYVVRDEDHIPGFKANQLRSVNEWQPEVVVMSVGGNNYREALQSTLYQKFKELYRPTATEEEQELKNENKKESFCYRALLHILSRQTPEELKDEINEVFNKVKDELFDDYKLIIDTFIAENKNLKRLVIMSQYYPELTQFTEYFIYAGFSHVARAQREGKSAFTVLHDTMNELYQKILSHVAKKNVEVVFADAASSFSPLGNHHVMQIEPNHRGARLMGKLIAEAVKHPFEDGEKEHSIAVVRYDEKTAKTATFMQEKTGLDNLSVKHVNEFISENRYSHIGHFFRAESTLTTRFESAYHMVMGKQFDAEFNGCHAFGLLDASLITIMASYLWRAALEAENNPVLRTGAAILSAPVLLIKELIGLSIILALSLPITLYHQIAGCFASVDAPSIHQNEGDDVSAVAASSYY